MKPNHNLHINFELSIHKKLHPKSGVIKDNMIAVQYGHIKAIVTSTLQSRPKEKI